LDIDVWRLNYGHATPPASGSAQAREVPMESGLATSFVTETTIRVLKDGEPNETIIREDVAGLSSSLVPRGIGLSRSIDVRSAAFGQRAVDAPRPRKWTSHSARSTADPLQDQALIAWLSQRAISARVDRNVDGIGSLTAETTDADDLAVDRAIDAFDDQALLTAL
jgi:hypothetical protein